MVEILLQRRGGKVNYFVLFVKENNRLAVQEVCGGGGHGGGGHGGGERGRKLDMKSLRSSVKILFSYQNTAYIGAIDSGRKF